MGPQVTPIAPLRALLARPDEAVLAIVSGIDGPSYRPLGAMMTVFDESDYAGSLSSGCIEADIALQAHAALESGGPMRVLYGKGSPYVDIQLPCGGGLEILLCPQPDLDVLSELVRLNDERRSCSLLIDIADGGMRLTDAQPTVRREDNISIRFDPEIFFQVFGKGPEASTFAALVQAAGYPNLLLSPDQETLDAASSSGCATRLLKSPHYPSDLAIDAWTAVTLFFHDHDWEPPILASALAADALYVGAQGSRAAAEQRLSSLEAMGVDEKLLARMRGPIGLIPSTRDARTLAVSVLAEVLSSAMPGTRKDAT